MYEYLVIAGIVAAAAIYVFRLFYKKIKHGECGTCKNCAFRIREDEIAPSDSCSGGCKCGVGCKCGCQEGGVCSCERKKNPSDRPTE